MQSVLCLSHLCRYFCFCIPHLLLIRTLLPTDSAGGTLSAATTTTATVTRTDSDGDSLTSLAYVAASATAPDGATHTTTTTTTTAFTSTSTTTSTIVTATLTATCKYSITLMKYHHSTLPCSATCYLLHSLNTTPILWRVHK